MESEEKLKELIGKYKSAVVAFSGGVDSTYLARVCQDVLGDKLLLVTATSSTYPFYELEESKKLAQDLGIEQKIIVSEEIDIPGFADNPPDRCYYCKGELFKLISHIAKEQGYDVVFDGSNADDLSDYRPGRKAIEEQGIISPLLDAGMTKDEIRKCSKEYGLPTADKPAYACLASRFPYGETITNEKLDRVGKAEFEMRKFNFSQLRIRSHGDLARVELAPSDLENGWKNRNEILSICKDAGFTFVSLDLEGYRTGAMNEMLDL